MVARGEVWLARDPTEGREIQKTRPCVIVSPSELHDFLGIIVVAPKTTESRPAPYRLPINFSAKRGFILLDQIRTIDKHRLAGRLGAISRHELAATLRHFAFPMRTVGLVGLWSDAGLPRS
ncbi:MAG: type II toxin-antitoxin system PemK/MazF family toxin [Pseudomonadota bacterium]